jgi:cytochrome c556
MKRIFLTGALLFGSLFSYNSMAQPSAEEMAQTSIANRQAVFKLLGYSMGPLGNMARTGEFDEAQAVRSLERIITLAPMIRELFGNDTSSYSFDTRARNIIWSNQDEFSRLVDGLVEGATTALGMINADGASAVRPAVGQVGPACGACHDRFRLE